MLHLSKVGTPAKEHNPGHCDACDDARALTSALGVDSLLQLLKNYARDESGGRPGALVVGVETGALAVAIAGGDDAAGCTALCVDASNATE